MLWDNFDVQTLVFNARFGLYLVAIAILAGIVAAGKGNSPFVHVAGVALNLLALYALTLEADSYFTREMNAWYQAHPRSSYGPMQQIELARKFSFSAI
jgi:hypothetical protein